MRWYVCVVVKLCSSRTSESEGGEVDLVRHGLVMRMRMRVGSLGLNSQILSAYGSVQYNETSIVVSAYRAGNVFQPGVPMQPREGERELMYV